MLRAIKKRRILSLFLLILFMTSTLTPAAEQPIDQPIKDKNLFLQKFTEAFKSNDQAKMKELVRQAETIIYGVVRNIAGEGVRRIATGQEVRGYFMAAEIIAKLYSEEFKKEALLELVRVYRQYSQEMCKEKLKADSLIHEGVSFFKKSTFREALNVWKDAMEIFKKIRDVAGEADSLMGLGNVYHMFGQHQEAIDYHKQALEIKRRIGDGAGEASSLNNSGLVYYSLGQYTDALRYYQQSLEIRRKIGDVGGEASSLNNIGNVYHRLVQFQEALNHYKQSLEIARRTGDEAGEGLILNNIGSLYDRIDQKREALNYHKEALEINRRTGEVAGEANSLNNIGVVYQKLGQYQEALNYFKQSLEIARQIGNVPGEAIFLNNIGAFYERLGQYAEAQQVFDKLVKLSVEVGEPELAWRAYRGLGASLWKSGKGEEAVVKYKKAIDVIEEIYQYTKGLKEEERSSMIGEKSFVYQEFIELLLELHRKQPTKGYDKEAFLISEKSKSRTFQELMAKAGAKIAFSGDETFKKMIGKEQQLIGELTNLRGLFTKEMSKPEKERNQEVIDPLKSQISKTEKSLTDLEIEIEVKYPRYADLKKPKPLTVEELQEILKPDETVVSYAIGKEKMGAFVIGKKSFKLIEMDTRKEELSKLVKEFRQGLEEIIEWKQLEGFDPEVSYKLYQKLFEPLCSELKGVTKLYLTADDVLYTLPFEALVDKGIDLKAFREARRRGRSGEGSYLGEYATVHYLIDTYTITYLPSASVLRSLRRYEKPGYGKWQRPLIAFADPIFSEEERKEEAKVKVEVKVKEKELKPKGISPETQLMAQLITRSTGSGKLERLKESTQEAEAISKELKGRQEDIYLREKATEENIYKINLKDSRYFLFSTHGLLGGDFSGVAEPALALTLIDNPPGKDGFLTMSEVLGLDLNSELIILSACNTSGRGDKAGSGEGFVGLTRSFMYAGSKSLLVTHWSVESESARDLMVNTMRLMNAKPRPEALREAKLKMKSSVRTQKGEKLSLSSPFFWAPFVLVGEGK